MTPEELEEARRKYMGKLVRILVDGRPASTDWGAGIVTRVRESPGLECPELRLSVANRGTESWYIDLDGYTAEIYGEET